MYLSTLTFTVLALPLLLLLYYCVPEKSKNGFLLCAGLLIYGWGAPLRLLVPLIFLLYHYGIGILLEKLLGRAVLSRMLLLGSVLLSSAALFLVRRMTDNTPDLLWPVGLAILTLQGIGYLIAVFRKKHEAERNFLYLALYLTFFPILYAGPLIPYAEFREQITCRKCSILNLGSGLGLFIRGLAEKVVLADTLGYVFRELRLSEAGEISMLTAWLTGLTFALYLYFELMGYSDMARGIAACLGFRFPRNFGQPFFSSTITGFMEGWNITHLVWFQQNFRHFLFRRTEHRVLQNLSRILMWMLIGLWYGSSSRFLIWGFLIGLLVTMERLFLGRILKRNYAFGLLYTAITMQFSWVLLFTDSFTEVLQYWSAMVGFGNGLVDSYGMYYLTSYAVLLLICYYIATDLFHNITEHVAANPVGKKIAALLPLLECVLLIFCFACMLYRRVSSELWLRL